MYTLLHTQAVIYVSDVKSVKKKPKQKKPKQKSKKH